jgi:hypothetical protein
MDSENALGEFLRARHDVRPKAGRVSRLTRPQVGDIDLQSNKLTVGGTDGLILVVFHAEPGSRNAELLGILGSLTAPRDPAGRDNPDQQPVDGQ